jgi:hypothetical protein
MAWVGERNREDSGGVEEAQKKQIKGKSGVGERVRGVDEDEKNTKKRRKRVMVRERERVSVRKVEENKNKEEKV